MKTKLIGFLLCLLIIATSIPAGGQIKQISIIKNNDEINPPLNRGTWMKTFDFTYYDSFNSVKQTSDGGFIIGGTTQPNLDNNDIWLVKTDNQGNIIWDKIFGGPKEEHCIKVEKTSDGGYILLGSTESFGNGKNDIWLIKTDSEGNKLWDQTYGDVNDDYAYDIQQTNDGGYILACSHFISITLYGLIIKIDENGEIEWNKTYDGPFNNGVYSIAQTADGNYSVLGSIENEEGTEYLIWLFKIGINGEFIWEKKFGNNQEIILLMELTDDGGNILSGLSSSPESEDLLLIKTNSDGEIMWKKTYDVGLFEIGFEVQQTYDGGFIITGFLMTKLLTSYAFLFKTDQNGKMEWIKRYGTELFNILFSCQQTTDGGYILAGEGAALTDPEAYALLIKTDDKGNVPRNRGIVDSLFLRFLERFPLLERFLFLLMK